MVDINNYIGDCKFDFTEQEKSLMDIFAGSWEHCHNSSCMDCEFNNGNEKFSVLLCMSYQYAKKLIDNGYKKVRHGKWLTWEEQFPDRKPTKKNNLGVFCNNCHSHADNMTDYCPNCGARMDGKE